MVVAGETLGWGVMGGAAAASESSMVVTSEILGWGEAWAAAERRRTGESVLCAVSTGKL